MPAPPQDIYVPARIADKAQDILAGIGIEASEFGMPRIRMWQRIWAVVLLSMAFIGLVFFGINMLR